MPHSEPSSLQQRGWARYTQANFAGPSAAETAASLDKLQTFFWQLPPDRYAPESGRHRRHTRGLFIPWEDRLCWNPDLEDEHYGGVVDYDMQGYNSEFPTEKRQMPSIPDVIRTDPLVERIVRHDVQQTLWHSNFERIPLSVGVGCIAQVTETPDQSVAATPNALHQDGGDGAFTFIHLITRDNVVGGENFVAPTRCVGMQPGDLSPTVIEATFTLETPLDSFVVHNSAVSHHVNPVHRGDENRCGLRGVLIVAISPLVKKL